MEIDKVLNDLVKNEEKQLKDEAFAKMSVEEQTAYIFNSILNITSVHKIAIDKIVNLLENLNEQNKEMRNRISTLEDKIDSIEEVL